MWYMDGWIKKPKINKLQKMEWGKEHKHTSHIIDNTILTRPAHASSYQEVNQTNQSTWCVCVCVFRGHQGHWGLWRHKRMPLGLVTSGSLQGARKKHSHARTHTHAPHLLFTQPCVCSNQWNRRWDLAWPQKFFILIILEIWGFRSFHLQVWFCQSGQKQKVKCCFQILPADVVWIPSVPLVPTAA